MAFESGTASDYRDLLERFRTFLTKNPALVAASQQWQELRWTADAATQELILKAPGLAGAEEIYCGLRSYANPTSGYYMWDLNGYIGFNPANGFYAQPGTLTGWVPMMSLWNAATPYWFVASGRRAVVVVKVSTLYEACHLGLILPYATPGQYPYPLFIGGSMTGQRGRNYSTTSPNHRHFADPGDDGQNNPNTAAMLRGPSGAWLPFQNVAYSSSEYRYDNPRIVWPTIYSYLGNQREAPDGTYVLTPLVLTQWNSGTDHDLFGELDGVYHVSGFNNAAENLIKVGGVDHLVVQNVYRTSVRDYWALRLA
ncbi:hypothetical protein OOT46_23120 [Aquabacterium sp. A7-Y]|uniref:hypothetical protein n=1 Tax=Aquabacterium sp. A7-Y TaxID=1349605 RepID=UPI00223E7A64|nr:hypothetical protein [Aquabacterium sp. A7-Y]MCW7540714.1 hypothetical protein [Aquabacterium sp. A7-Y]